MVFPKITNLKDLFQRVPIEIEREISSYMYNYKTEKDAVIADIYPRIHLDGSYYNINVDVFNERLSNILMSLDDDTLLIQERINLVVLMMKIDFQYFRGYWLYSVNLEQYLLEYYNTEYGIKSRLIDGGDVLDYVKSN